MPEINNLSTIDNLNGGDQVPVYDVSAGTARKASMSQMLAFFSANFASPEYEVIISAPIDGFNQQLGSQTKSVWLILNPLATLATGTITLPPVAGCFDGQEVLVTSSAEITSVTVLGNGATVTGAPTALQAGGFFALRYNKLLTTWFCVAQSLGATNNFTNIICDTIQVNDAIRTSAGSDAIKFAQEGVGTAVNHLLIINSTLGEEQVGVVAAGDDTDIDLTLQGKGAGRVVVNDSLRVSGGATVDGDLEALSLTATLGATISGGVAVTSDGIAVTGDSAVVGNLDVTGTIEASVLLRSLGPVLSFGYLVAGLPPAGSLVGGRAFVTNSNATMTAGIGAVVAGGGVNVVPVFSDGVNWRIG